jgi:uncharacterized protein involved in outer membrane biogenesis
VTTDAYEPTQPGHDPGRRPVRPGERRPLTRARTWTRERWQGARARLATTKPHHKTIAWTAGVFLTLAVAIMILVAIWDWNWFRGPLARLASAKMHREVTIDGDLHVHLFSWQPSATVDGVKIANPDWAGKDKMADIGRIAVKIRLIPLFTGHLDLRRLEFDKPNVRLVRDAQGRANYDFSDGKKKDEPLRMPPIRNFIINDGHLTYHDVKRQLTFTGTVNAHERLGERNHGFEMTGQGALNRAPFTLQVVGGPLLNIDRDKPYPFNAHIRAGETYVTAEGAVPKPFDLGQFYMNTTARGPDMSDLYGITGIALPNTPAYNLRGRLSRDEHTWRIDGLGGRVGNSDLGGDLSVKTGGARPFLKANLRSASLDFGDLGAIFGGAPASRAVASASQAAVAKTLAAQQRIFPDSTLKVDRIRAMDADVTYKAASIKQAPINLRAGAVHVKLDDGLLTADPLSFDLPQGRIAGNVRLNARNAIPVTDLDLRLTNARIEQLLPIHVGGGPPLTGALVGRAKLHGAGDSVHKAFASADGQVTVVAPGGEVRAAFAELAGVDVTKGLGLLLKKDQQMTPLRCGVANFRTKNGVMTADNIVIDTGPVLIAGSGTVNLDTERMDFKVQGHPKKFRLVHLALPVTASGPLRSPKLGVEPGKAIAQGGVAVALGAVLTPLAAILPFIDAGLAKDANCGALLSEASQQGAPLKASQVAARVAH